jgi:T-complex protein 1 subunit beta
VPGSVIAIPCSHLIFLSCIQILIGEDKVLRFGGCKSGEACSIVLRGASSHALAEAERSLHDALAILTSTVKQPVTVFGGGCTEIAMAAAVDRAAEETPGKKALAMAAFARALRQLPTSTCCLCHSALCLLLLLFCQTVPNVELALILSSEVVADNGGYDAAELVTQLRAAHAAGNATAGLDMSKGCVGDMKELGVRESFHSKQQMLLSAAEAAEMIVRVDDIIKAAPRRREEMGY